MSIVTPSSPFDPLPNCSPLCPPRPKKHSLVIVAVCDEVVGWHLPMKQQTLAIAMANTNTKIEMRKFPVPPRVLLPHISSVKRANCIPCLSLELKLYLHVLVGVLRIPEMPESRANKSVPICLPFSELSKLSPWFKIPWGCTTCSWPSWQSVARFLILSNLHEWNSILKLFYFLP